MTAKIHLLGRSLNERGEEINNEPPVEIPTHLRLPQSTDDKIRQILRSEEWQKQMRTGMDSFEEAEDFNMEENGEWFSPFEEGFDMPNQQPPAGQVDGAPAPAPGGGIEDELPPEVLKPDAARQE